MNTPIKAVAVAIGKILLYAGWLMPLWLAIYFMLQAWRVHETGTGTQHSFPFVAATGDAITVAFVWLAVAIAVRVVREKRAK